MMSMSRIEVNLFLLAYYVTICSFTLLFSTIDWYGRILIEH